MYFFEGSAESAEGLDLAIAFDIRDAKSMLVVREVNVVLALGLVLEAEAVFPGG